MGWRQSGARLLLLGGVDAWVCGTGYWVLGSYTACIAGQIRQAQRSRARAVELTCSERWAGRGQAAWAGQGSSTGQW